MGYGIDVLTKEDNQEFYSCSALGLPHGPPFLFAGKSSTCPAFIHRVPLRKWPVLFEWQNDLANALGTVFCAASTWWLQAAVNLGNSELFTRICVNAEAAKCRRPLLQQHLSMLFSLCSKLCIMRMTFSDPRQDHARSSACLGFPWPPSCLRMARQYLPPAAHDPEA